MFTQEQISHMVRMGELDGKPVERTLLKLYRTPKAQIRKIKLVIDNRPYMVTQTYPYKENQIAVDNCEPNQLPRIILYYDMEEMKQ